MTSGEDKYSTSHEIHPFDPRSSLTIGNELREKVLTPSARWDDLLDRVRYQTTKTDGVAKEEKPLARWRRAAFLVGRLQGRNRFHPNDNGDVEKSKSLETQHWLENIDPHHRYGSNLKIYHLKWQMSDTKENFFYWLDKGEGRDISLKDCPRPQLEDERIKYLSVEERLDYLVEIKDGTFVWAANGRLVHTFDPKRGIWQKLSPDENQHDSVLERKEKAEEGQKEPDYMEAEIEEEMNDRFNNIIPHEGRKEHYADQPGRNPLKPSNVLQMLLKKTLLPNTWIFVTDESLNMYVGPKESGKFQHSSFLSGGRVTAAGLLQIKEGKLVSLSPLSGHYRCTTDYFDKLMKHFEERGVDTKAVKIGQSYIALKSLENYKSAKIKIGVKFSNFFEKLGIHQEKESDESLNDLSKEKEPKEEKKLIEKITEQKNEGWKWTIKMADSTNIAPAEDSPEVRHNFKPKTIEPHTSNGKKSDPPPPAPAPAASRHHGRPLVHLPSSFLHQPSPRNSVREKSASTVVGTKHGPYHKMDEEERKKEEKKKKRQDEAFVMGCFMSSIHG
ncbi:hypothetical protein PROFUN_07338 [Planoprotostelium fungivorum]|uniref:IQ calmodulin-binding motif family protein n=1 Tax=Planoprotostelium fungivorum TaxID=1890364 RepID=A0A2P6N2H6_9EUKA|nr:hypothetical protein PROFUN_11289 [Planoprotostelium fungivorum]PRP84953.1 hypothetical protein PROFUN_07338 [Planoprotostelium fungivorum]